MYGESCIDCEYASYAMCSLGDELCRKGIETGNEPMDEQMLEKDCFTCANAFVDDDDKLHCMADGHDHEQIVADDYTCDDWTR